MSLHWNVNCDGCGDRNMLHFRYKCLRCPDFDLCRNCYENKVEVDSHTKEHPFQCLLDRKARELFFAGECIPDMCAESFTCPICGEMGSSQRDLIKHTQGSHKADMTPVICPICVSVPAAHPRRVFDIATHLLTSHTDVIRQISIANGITNDLGSSTSGANTQRAGGFSMTSSRGIGAVNSMPRLLFVEELLGSSTLPPPNRNDDIDTPE